MIETIREHIKEVENFSSESRENSEEFRIKYLGKNYVSSTRAEKYWSIRTTACRKRNVGLGCLRSDPRRPNWKDFAGIAAAAIARFRKTCREAGILRNWPTVVSRSTRAATKTT